MFQSGLLFADKIATAAPRFPYIASSNLRPTQRVSAAVPMRIQRCGMNLSASRLPNWPPIATATISGRPMSMAAANLGRRHDWTDNARRVADLAGLRTAAA